VTRNVLCLDSKGRTASYYFSMQTIPIYWPLLYSIHSLFDTSPGVLTVDEVKKDTRNRSFRYLIFSFGGEACSGKDSMPDTRR